MNAALPVLFRAQKENGRLWITAVFPTEPGSNDASTFTIYQHIGQHGIGSRGWYNQTRAAKPAEYAPLLAELRGIYGTSIGEGDPIIELRVVRRFTKYHDTQRRTKLVEMTR
jgi:hypothetical protein